MWQEIAQNLQAKLNELRGALSFAPAWAVSAVVLVIAFIAAWLIRAATLALLRRLLRNRRPYLQTIIETTKNPTRLALLIVALAIALPTTPLGADAQTVLVRSLVLATICMFGWTTLTVLRTGANLYLRNFRIAVDDNLLARKHVTQVRVLLTAASAANTSDLCAEPREKLIGFPQREHPEAPPRRRNEIIEAPARKDRAMPSAPGSPTA